MPLLIKAVTYYFIIFLFLFQSDTLNSNAEKKHLRITTTNSMPPYSFTDKNGKPAGIIIDFWKLWAKKNNVRVEFILTSWNESLKNVKNGNADFHGGLYKSETRSKFLKFSNSFVNYTTSIFVSSKLKIDSFDDLLKLKIPVAVTLGSYTVEHLKKRYKNIQLKLYKTYDALLRNSIASHELCFAVDHSVAYYYLSKLDALGKFRILTDLATHGFRAGVKKTNHGLVNFINSGLEKIKENEIEKILGKWVVKKYKFPAWLKKALIFGITSLLIFFLILQWILLKIEVNMKTRELNNSKKILDIINKDMREANLSVQSRIEFLEKVNKAKDETIEMIAEDLNFPLEKIKQSIEKIEEKNNTHDIENIHNEISTLINLVNKILRISKIESQVYQATMIKKNLKEPVNSLKKEFKEMAAKKNIDFKIEILSSSVISYINEVHFKEIVINLVTNAIKFTPLDGKITLVLDRQNIDNEDKCIIKVKDSGIGMEKEEIDKLFLFKDTKSKPGTLGEWTTGLGLVIVKKFVDLHNGYVDVESKKEKGSTFTVYLPAISQFSASFEEIKFDLHTGDIFLFKGINKDALELFGDYINWTHVAMIVKFPESGEILLLESTDLETVFDKKLNKKKKGPQLVSLTERLKTYQTDLFAIRHLKVALTDEMLNKLNNFIYKIHGLTFPGDLKIIWRFIKGKLFGRLFKRKKKYRDIFCSELIAQAYTEMGLLPKHIQPASFLPSDFSSRGKLPFLKGAYLGPEIFISLENINKTNYNQNGILSK